MKFTLSWLNDYLRYDGPIEALAATLDKIGLEVKGVENPARALAGFRVAEIVKTNPHPDADRLQLCEVRDQPGGKTFQIVCGAPNARAGIKVVLATPGAVVPASGMVIKKGKIRGQESAGMLCSASELGLSAESDGILELAPETKVGMSLAEALNLDDPVVEIGITPNRGDALSVCGIARDLNAASLGQPVQKTSPQIKVSKVRAGEKFSVGGAHDSAPVLWGRTLRGVKNGKSPEALAGKLRKIGQRSQSAIVDAVNEVMFALGSPLHAFDMDALHGGIRLDHARKDEKFLALNGGEYVLEAEDLVIRDERGNIAALAGIMGGKASAVSLKTKNVFLEAAWYDPAQIARTGRRLGLSSEARFRFERDVDPALIPEALDWATARIQEFCGGEAGEIQKTGEFERAPRSAFLRLSRLEEITGLKMEREIAGRLLTDLGCQVSRDEGDVLEVQIPSWRRDLASPKAELAQFPGLSAEDAEKAASQARDLANEAELIGEIVRLQGLDEIPLTPLAPLAERKTSADNSAGVPWDILRAFLGSRGLMETIGFSFTRGEENAFFGENFPQERLENPISQEFSQLRATPLPTLLNALARNLARGLGDHGEAGLYEIGAAFGPHGGQEILAAVRGGEKPRFPGRPASFFGWRDAKSDLLGLLGALGFPEESLEVQAEAQRGHHPGRSGVVKLGPATVLGRFGEIHPDVAEFYGIVGPVAFFEFYPENLPKKPKKAKKKGGKNEDKGSFSALQPVRRDFAFLVKDGVPVGAVLNAVLGAERKFISRVRAFDFFRGEGGKAPNVRPINPKDFGSSWKGAVGEEYYSLGVEVILQPVDESFSGAQLQDISSRIVRRVQEKTGARLRG